MERPPIEGLDVYATQRPNAPVNVFVHGGAWQRYGAKDYAFPAELFVNAGAHFVVLDFINVDQAGGSLLPMADQVRRAVAWVANNAQSFGGDPNRVYVWAHSSGAHLGAVALVTDSPRDFGLPRDVVKGALLCSGMYDLKPVRLSAEACRSIRAALAKVDREIGSIVTVVPGDRAMIERALALFEEMNATGWIVEARAALDGLSPMRQHAD